MGAGAQLPARRAVLQPCGAQIQSARTPVPRPCQLHHHGLVPRLALGGEQPLPSLFFLLSLSSTLPLLASLSFPTCVPACVRARDRLAGTWQSVTDCNLGKTAALLQGHRLWLWPCHDAPALISPILCSYKCVSESSLTHLCPANVKFAAAISAT